MPGFSKKKNLRAFSSESFFVVSFKSGHSGNSTCYLKGVHRITRCTKTHRPSPEQACTTHGAKKPLALGQSDGESFSVVHLPTPCGIPQSETSPQARALSKPSPSCDTGDAFTNAGCSICQRTGSAAAGAPRWLSWDVSKFLSAAL